MHLTCETHSSSVPTWISHTGNTKPLALCSLSPSNRGPGSRAHIVAGAPSPKRSHRLFGFCSTQHWGHLLPSPKHTQQAGRGLNPSLLWAEESPQSELSCCAWIEPASGPPQALSGERDATACRSEAHLKMLHPSSSRRHPQAISGSPRTCLL